MISTATRTNRTLLGGAAVLVALSLVVPIVANTSDDSQATPTTSTSSSSSTTIDASSDTTFAPEPYGDEPDAIDFDPQLSDAIDPAVGKLFVRDRVLKTATLAYPFPELWLERTPPIRVNPFVHGIFDRFHGGGGMQQSPFIPRLYQIGDEGLTCDPQEWDGYMACGIGSSSRGRFQVAITRYQTNSLDWYDNDQLDITIYAEGNRGESKYALSALRTHLSVSKCVYISGQGRLTLQKVRVGDEDVFVLKIDGGFRADINDNVYNNDDAQIVVIAMGESGIPEVVAGYEIEDLQQVAATNRSLILTVSDDDSMWDEDLPYGTGLVIELIPSPTGWKERLHPLPSGRDPLWGIANFKVKSKEIAKGIGKSLTLLDYTSLRHISRFNDLCSDYENE